MMRVPGSNTNLFDAKAKGADVRMVYSPLDALKIAKQNPEQHVIFLALGFETTSPSTAMTILQAEKDKVENFSVFCNHIMIVPALKAMLDSPDLKLDGFVGPGHVSTVIGTRCYEFVPQEYGKPLVVTGFEPLDVLQSVYMIVKQITEGRAEVENQYGRVVERNGNRKALEVLAEVFEPRDFSNGGAWLNSAQRNEIKGKIREIRCRTEIRRPGLTSRRPESLPMRRNTKRREKTLGMQSFRHCLHARNADRLVYGFSEGACAAYYNFGRLSKIAQRSASTGVV